MNARGVEAARVVKCKRIDGRECRSRHRTGNRQILIAFHGRRDGRARSLAAGAALKVEASKIAEIEIRAAERVI